MRELRLGCLIRRGKFESEEPEFFRLGEWLRSGDVAMDIGANFGAFTLRMSDIVGDSGRVFAFEPVPQTFAMLIRSISARNCRNVSALNLACSDATGFTTMSIPDDSLTGEDLYRASISGNGPSLVPVCRVRLDDLVLPIDGLKVVKIDAEGHDSEVIYGMWNVLTKFMPVLITEHPSDTIAARLAGIGYQLTKQAGSPNGVFLPPARGPHYDAPSTLD